MTAIEPPAQQDDWNPDEELGGTFALDAPPEARHVAMADLETDD